MEKERDIKAAEKVEVSAKPEKKYRKRKVSKTWEAMQRLKGSLIVNDPKFLL